MIDEGILTEYNRHDWHHLAFNEDYYIIGYYESSEWLKKHEIGELEGAGICVQYEKDNFGGSTKIYDNTEMVANMLAYIYGEELLNEVDLTEDMGEIEVIFSSMYG
jgi:hypothetical protein